MQDQNLLWRNYRGSFACVGSDDVIYTVEATYDVEGKIVLALEDGRLVRRYAKGRYVATNGVFLRLTCDHPDAP